jgi:hypothetical protein
MRPVASRAEEMWKGSVCAEIQVNASATLLDPPRFTRLFK